MEPLSTSMSTAGGMASQCNNHERSHQEPQVFPTSLSQQIDQVKAPFVDVSPSLQRKSKMINSAKVGGKRKWKKPKDKPKRPLSAYNIFFQKERLQMLAATTKEVEPNYSNEGNMEIEDSFTDKKIKAGSTGLAGLTRNIAAKWNSLDGETRSLYEVEAKKELLKYARAVEDWKNKRSQQSQEDDSNVSLVSALKVRKDLVGNADERSDETARQSNASAHIRQQLNFHRLEATMSSRSLQTPIWSSSILPGASRISDCASSNQFHNSNMLHAQESFLRFQPDFFQDVSVGTTKAGVTSEVSSSDIFTEATTNRYIDPESLSWLISQLDEDEQECIVSFRDA